MNNTRLEPYIEKPAEPLHFNGCSDRICYKCCLRTYKIRDGSESSKKNLCAPCYDNRFNKKYNDNVEKILRMKNLQEFKEDPKERLERAVSFETGKNDESSETQLKKMLNYQGRKVELPDGISYHEPATGGESVKSLRINSKNISLPFEKIGIDLGIEFCKVYLKAIQDNNTRLIDSLNMFRALVKNWSASMCEENLATLKNLLYNY